MSQPILLDASCVLAWAFGESGAQLVEAVLPTAYITSVNLTEVVDKLERQEMKELSLQRTSLRGVSLLSHSVGRT